MRWPEEVNPPKKTKNKKKRNKKQKKNKKEREKKQKTQKCQKKSFSVINQFFPFFGGCPKFPFLTTWPKKRAPKKHYKNRGFSNPFFGKQF